ncbi:MAG TPA: hypothetical protein VNZ66_00445 [Aeromicrobium sp.]|nr:hypothetical protein [Aeromicrobium sp.]
MSNARERRRRGKRRLNLHQSGPWIGVVGLFVNLWLTISSVLYAPWWGMVVLLAYLVPQTWLIRRWATEYPVRCVWVPLGGAGVWALTVVVGAQWWGWSVS